MALNTTVVANSGSSVTIDSDLFRLLRSGTVIELFTVEAAVATAEVMIENVSQESGSGKAYKRKYGLGYHIASAPGQFPAKDSGDLKNAIGVTFGTSRESADVVVESEYALDLEYGTSKMRARPFMIRSLNEAMSTKLPQIFNNLVKHIDSNALFFEQELARLQRRSRRRARNRRR